MRQSPRQAVLPSIRKSKVRVTTLGWTVGILKKCGIGFFPRKVILTFFLMDFVVLRRPFAVRRLFDIGCAFDIQF